MGRLKEYRKDLILILAVLVGAGLIAGAFALARKPGAYVRVEQNGKTVGIYRLDEDRREVFPDEAAGGTSGEKGAADGTVAAGNVLVIEDGRVYMESASCPDKLCVKQGIRSQVGETIVCLPHRLVATVISAEEAEELMP